MVTAAVVSLGLWLAAAPSAADTDPRSISVPLLGTQGPASRYPSTIVVDAPAFTLQRGQVKVQLHKVTHPCPEHLAVLLVHGQPFAKYLLMSGAGGCRPLQGTDIQFSPAFFPLANPQLPGPPFGSLLQIGASNYGILPTFPAPAPAGPYILGLPPADGYISGGWSLYVIDTTDGERGVIAGGWSLQYDNSFLTTADQTTVALPGLGTGPGVAAQYPITFNLTGVRPEVHVNRVFFTMTLNHTNPDDLRIVLQSPSGTTVALMINAGGTGDIDPGTTLNFGDFATSSLSDTGQINAGTYRPGAVFGATVALPGPAPPPPYETAFSAFTGEPAAGTWRLWAYDDKSVDIGEISSAGLYISIQPTPGLTSLTPVSGTVSTQPFVRVEGGIINALPGPTTAYSITWRVINGASTYYDSGAFSLRPGTSTFVANVPVRQGSNLIVATLIDPFGQGVVSSTTVNVNEFTYALAEGATGGFFDTDVTIGNATDTAAPVTIDFLPEAGTLHSDAINVSAQGSRQLHVDDFVPGDAVSTVVHSTAAVPLAVERTMSWDARGYGGHGGEATAPATTWLFAEGSQGYFDTYVLLANGGATAADVTIRFLLEGGGVVQHVLSVPAQSRRTIDCGSIATLVNQSFGIDIASTQPIIAERAMYFPHGSARIFEGGHESAGVNETNRSWFLAEGATGPFFETFVLLMNPNPTDAHVAITYLLPSSATVAQPVVVPANSRLTINVETVDPQLANTPVSTRISSDIGIVVERAMYWPDVSQGWQEAHDSFGMTELGLRWGLADGRLGGARGYETYVLLANPNTFPAEVRVRFFKPGLVATRTYTVSPTSRLNVQASQEVPELGGDSTFNVEVEVLNFIPIAVEKAMYWNADGVTWAAGTNVTATRLPPP